MLRSFRLQNHRSFQGEAELSLLPSYSTEWPTVPVAAIYGANAAGKSNLLDGLRFMSGAVRDSYRRWEPDGGVPRQPFRLDPASATDPSTFVVDVMLDHVRHVYGFVVDDRQVCEEWLHTYPKGKERVIFEREESSVEFGSTVSESRSRSETLAELTRPNALFLSLAAQVGWSELTPVREWFASGLHWAPSRFGTPSARSMSLAQFLTDDQTERDGLVDLLRAADVGITGVVVERGAEVTAVTPGATDAAMRSYLQDQLRSAGDRGSDLMIGLTGEGSAALGRWWELTTSDGRQRVRFVHGNPAAPFDFVDESAGTQAWISLLPAVLGSLRRASTLVIDEIDTSLHPHLTAHLVRMFQSEKVNPAGAQLIFTTQDASLLGTSFGEEVLRRDQVWFVEKNAAGNSTLYPLTDFHPRRDENRERRYLGGSYGAVPIVEDPER